MTKYENSGEGYWVNPEDPSRGIYGIPPEIEREREEEMLLERGSLEKIVDESKKDFKQRKRTVSDTQYRKFYQEVLDLNLSLNIGFNPDKKAELLARYFPGRFGDKGRNPVCNMEALKIGNLFKKVVYYSQRR